MNDTLFELPQGLAATVERLTISQRALVVYRAYQAVTRIRGVMADEANIRIRGLTQGQIDALRTAAEELEAALP